MHWNDALGNAFAQMVDNLRRLIGQVRTTADNLGGASQQLSILGARIADEARNGIDPEEILA